MTKRTQLTNEQRAEIAKRYEAGEELVSVIARDFNIQSNYVRQVVKRYRARQIRFHQGDIMEDKEFYEAVERRRHLPRPHMEQKEEAEPAQTKLVSLLGLTNDEEIKVDEVMSAISGDEPPDELLSMLMSGMSFSEKVAFSVGLVVGLERLI